MAKRRNNKEEKVNITPNTWKQVKRFAKFFRPNLPLFTLGWLFLLFSSISAVVFPTLMGQLVGQKEGQDPIMDIGGVDLTDLNTLLIILFVVFALQAFFSFFRVVIFNIVTERTLFSIKSNLFSKLIGLPKSFYDKEDSAGLVSRVSNDIQLIQSTINTTIAEFFRQILTVLVALFAIFYFSSVLAFWMLAVVPVLAIVALVFGRYVRKLSKSAQDFNAKSNNFMQTALTGIVNVKVFNNEKLEVDRYEKNMKEVRRLNIKNGLVRGLFVSFIIFCMFGGISFVIWKAKSLEVDGVITNAQFVTFIFYTVMLGTSFASLPELYATIQKSLGATEDVMNLIDLEDEFDVNNENALNFSSAIQMKNLSFAYPSRPELNVLEGISLEINKGEHVAFVGGSGGGKSTFAALLLGLYKDYQGSLTLDGQEWSAFDLRRLRSLIGYVPQDIQLFNGSIAENIGYGKENSTREEIEKVAQMAFVTEFAHQFEGGLDTMVGERGVQLSGGQRQRIAIARAMLKNPEIIIFDEATSALDNETESKVQEALYEFMKNRTSITIAHRLSTIKTADKIFVLNQGKLVETGNHQALMQNEDSLYKQLYQKSLSEVSA